MIVLIPAYKPDNSLIRLTHQLTAHSESIQVLVIDDGSGSEYAPIFTELTLTGATVMLKGGYSLIASPADTVYSVRGATAWLATAGSGDTLTGILGALLAQKVAAAAQCGTPLEDDVYARVAALAVYLHGRAALASLGGRRGPVPPTRVAQSLPQAIAELLEY